MLSDRLSNMVEGKQLKLTSKQNLKSRTKINVPKMNLKSTRNDVRLQRLNLDTSKTIINIS